jgi:hypothetical protein
MAQNHSLLLKMVYRIFVCSTLRVFAITILTGASCTGNRPNLPTALQLRTNVIGSSCAAAALSGVKLADNKMLPNTSKMLPNNYNPIPNVSKSLLCQCGCPTDDVGSIK